jgi:tRNA 5-methylaminomethyl-2-thiouridine biosynthesis bifunctional protein
LDADGRPLADADEVVLANAVHAPGLIASAGMDGVLPKVAAMQRMAGQVAYFSATPTSDGRSIVAGEGYWLPAADGVCVGGSTYEIDADHTAVTGQGRTAVQGKLAAMLVEGAPLQGPPNAELRGWAGWRATAKDRLPVIGSIDGARRLWLATGYGSRGLSWSALAGDIIAATLDNEPVPLERELMRKIIPR